MENQQETGGDSSSHETPKYAQNKGVTSSVSDSSSTSNAQSKVSTADSADTMNVPRNNKPDNKLSNKLDADLTAIVEGWPSLPGHVKVTIKTLVEAYRTKGK